MILAISSTCASVIEPTTSLARRLRALVEPGRLAQQHRRGRGLEDEREGAVLEDRDLDRDDRAALGSVAALYCLHEVHGRHAVGAEGGADGGAGVALPAGIWILTIAGPSSSPLAYSLESERIRPVGAANKCGREGDGELQLRDLANSSSTGVSRPKMLTRTLTLSWSSLISTIVAGEVGERAFLDPDRLAHLVLEPRLGAGFGRLFAVVG